MRRVALKNLLAHKVRLLLSALAVVLGVAFVVGTLVFTDTLERSFSDIVGETQPDVVVRPVSETRDIAGDPGAGVSTATLPGSLVDEIAALDDVERADPDLTVPVSVFVLDRDGKVVGGQGAPGIATNYSDQPGGPDRVPIVTLESGREPTAAGEVALDIATVEKSGYALGDTVPMVTTGDPASLDATLVGEVRFGANNNLVGASLLLFDAEYLQDTFLGGQDVATQIGVTAVEGADLAAVRDEVAALVPPDTESLLGTDVADEQREQIGVALGFVNTFLLVFAFVAGFVGIFIIFNTFSILVAQRARELALLRALGASRPQVRGAVLAEAVVVGLVGSTLGLLAGLGLALGLRALFGAIGLELGSATLIFLPRTIVVAYLVGVVVTVVAASLPARRASRVPPVAAMRDQFALAETSRRRWLLLGGLLLVLGVAGMTLGLVGAGPQPLLSLGLGIVGVLLSAAMLTLVVGPPLVRLLGAPFVRLFGTVGSLARENARRSPVRTAVTAAALMIGLALVSTFAILGASAKDSVRDVLETGLKADFVVSNAVQQPFSPQIGEQMAEVDDVAAVSPYRFGFGLVDGGDELLAGIDPTTFAEAVTVDMVSGSLSDLQAGTTLVEAERAADEGWTVGETLTVTLPTGPRDLEVAGTYERNDFIGTAVVLSFDDLTAGGVPTADTIVYVVAEPEAELSAVRAGLDEVVADQPLVSVQDGAEFAGSQAAQVDQLLNLIYALLGLALVIAVLGIVNTLALSVIERTREIGLLRAVGVSRRQLRTMVRLESVIVAVLGAVLGIALGIAFGTALQRAIADDGLNVLTIPWGQLAVFVVVAGLVGVLAAVLPARRAARLDVLRAITTE